MSDTPTIDWRKIAHEAGGFGPQVFDFIREGLDHAVRMVHGAAGVEVSSEDESRHITGEQLCLGLRDLAVERYGGLARTVLEHWNVRTTEDFGRLVFALIDAGVLRKTDEDRFEDFIGVYDFDEAFGEAGAV
jgi:uncharacterized repeat protein (TIGR04138 family)